MERNSELHHWADILVIAIYFLSVLCVGLWSMTRSKRGNVQSYFLANRSMSWITVGASLFSSNIGAEHFVGLAGAGASTGIPLVMFEWLPALLILLLGWYFIPVYTSARAFTSPEYMEKRFGSKKIKNYFSLLTLIFAVATKLAANMFAGSLFIQMASGWNMYLSVIILLVVTVTYTILGGLTAVMYTDTFQTAVMVLGAFIVTGLSFHRIGDMEDLREKYLSSVPKIRDNYTTCAFPREDAFHLFQDPVTGYQPWPGLLIQATLGVVFYWCTDQVIVQRAFAAKSLLDAKGGSLLAAFLKILPLYLMVFPGMISRILFPDEVGCVDPDECLRICDNPSGCSNIAYPKLVLELLPAGLRGLLMAVILSAIMSSLTSIFNSSSTLFTMDFWRQIRPMASQRELLIAGRLFIMGMCGVSILWLPLTRGGQGGQLFAYINMIQSCLMPAMGIAALFAIFWKRTTEKSVFFTLLISHAVGCVRIVLEFVYPVPACGEPETRPPILYKVHFLYFGTLQVLLSILCIVIISLLTEPRSEQQLKHLTWWTRVNPSDDSYDEDNIEDNPVDSKSGIQFTETNGNEGAVQYDENVVSSETQETRCLRIRRSLYSFLFGNIEDSYVAIDMNLNQIRVFLSEEPTKKHVVNAFAIVLIATICFLSGVYM